MDNKEYLDKVVGSILRGTKIDYENENIYLPFRIYDSYSFSSFSLLPPDTPLDSLFIYFTSFFKYCRNEFGLTTKEVEYVLNIYKDIIIEKINNGE